MKPFTPQESSHSEAVVPLRVLKENRAVPWFLHPAGEYRRVAHSLSSKVVRSVRPDGGFEIVVLPASFVGQFVSCICAGVAAAVLPMIIYGLCSGEMAAWNPSRTMWIILLAGGVAGGIASKWLIRRDPRTLLSCSADGAEIQADSGRVRLRKTEIRRLLAVCGDRVWRIPCESGERISEEEERMAVLTAVRAGATGEEEAVLLNRFPFPEKVILKAAKLAAAELDLPLKIKRFE